ncbi:MAG: sulfatase-like hydrolase/transferase, partial [Bacteroidetes bacterium]|nr:sulfatase-like hydrolase/transferase [Bacteroidota bacterium]
GDHLAITPNLDNIAQNGTVFLNNHTQQAVCGPTRASLMTGKRPDYTKVRDLKTKMRDMNPDIVSIPQYFKENGYITAGTGKIYDPRCVDEFLDKPSWSVPYVKEHEIPYPEKYGKPALGYYQNEEIKNKIAILEKEAKAKGIKNSYKYIADNYKPPFETSNAPDEAYTDGAIAEHAMTLLDDVTKDQSKPFFLAVGFKRPHLPFVASQKYWDLYKRADFKIATFQKKSKNGPDLAYHNSSELRSYKDPGNIEYTLSDENLLTLDADTQRELIHGYYACVSFVDTQIGKIMAKLKQKGLDKNTIIVVWGDHGWHLGDHSMWNKHSNFEQATRSPLIVYSPYINKPINISSPTEFVDLFPTLCEMSGLEVPENLDGKSLLPLINAQSKSVKNYAVSQWPRGKDMGYSFRTAKFRYTVWVKGKKSIDEITEKDIIAEELYDYENDPLETENHINDPRYERIQQDLIAYSKIYFATERNKTLQKTTTKVKVSDKPIKEIVKDKFPSNNVMIGATIGKTQFNTEVEKLFLKDFNYATSRNFAKQSRVHPEPTIWDWEKVDEFIAFGEKNNIDLRFHSPVSPQASRWAKTDSRTAEELEKNMTEYMTALCKRINNVKTIKWMDVVNETIERDGDWFKDKPGVKQWENPWVKMGYNKDGIPNYILKSFDISNKYAPNISQVFNQHGGMEPVMWEKVKETILYLRAKGYKIDGLGWQGHLKPASRVVEDSKNLKYLGELIDWAHANDLDFHITEFDYHLKTGENTPENYKKQADAYTKILTVLLEKSKTGLVTFNSWGISDLDDGLNTHRFLYDENMKPKPAYFAIKNALVDGDK